MPYGPERIPAHQLLHGMMHDTSQELQKHAAFNNPSIAYIGIKYKHKYEIELHSNHGEPQTHVIEVEGAMGKPTDPNPEIVKGKVERVAGVRKNLKKGEHTRTDRKGTKIE